QGGASIAGSVSIAAPDGSSSVIPGVTVTLTCGNNAAAAPAVPMVEVTNERGEFTFSKVTTSVRSCSIVAELQGFASATTTVAVNAGETSTVSLRLGLDTLREEVTVSAKPLPVDDDSIGARIEKMTPAVMDQAP